jgi:hypothetical protein
VCEIVHTARRKSFANLAFERLAAESRLSATAIQAVGSKGYDGFALALVTDAAPLANP